MTAFTHRLLNTLENKRNHVLFVFFSSFFIVGVFILPNYGLSWDEGCQRMANGEVVFNYIFANGRDALLQGNEKYHGPAFELLLTSIEKIMHLKDTRQVFLMRHFVTFLTFFASVICFYFLCKHCFKNWKLALLGCVFLVLSPRIFADAFYNSKDIIFLSFFIVGMYTLLLFHERRTYLSAILYALAAALAIDVRILGILLPAISLGLIGIDILQSILNKGTVKMKFGVFTVFTLFLVSFTILFWPVLWEGPIKHFKNALIEMSRYHWSGEMLYGGNIIAGDKLPWHYLFVWISISILFLICYFFCWVWFTLLKRWFLTQLFISSKKQNIY